LSLSNDLFSGRALHAWCHSSDLLNAYLRHHNYEEVSLFDRVILKSLVVVFENFTVSDQFLRVSLHLVLELNLFLGLPYLFNSEVIWLIIALYIVLCTYSVGFFNLEWQLFSLECLDDNFHFKILYIIKVQEVGWELYTSFPHKNLLNNSLFIVKKSLIYFPIKI